MRKFDTSYLLHALLSGLLLLKEFSLPCDIASIAFGDDVLAERLDCVGRDNLATDCSLDSNFILLSRYDLAELFNDSLTSRVGERPVNDEG